MCLNMQVIYHCFIYHNLNVSIFLGIKQPFIPYVKTVWPATQIVCNNTFLFILLYRLCLRIVNAIFS